MTEEVRYRLMTEAALFFFASAPSAVAELLQLMLVRAKETEPAQ
jgi:hypothetical protein